MNLHLELDQIIEILGRFVAYLAMNEIKSGESAKERKLVQNSLTVNTYYP